LESLSAGVSACASESQVSQKQGLALSPDATAPLRILFVTQSYFPFLDRGGPALKVRSLARGLKARGHEITVLTTDLGLAKHGEGLPLSCSPWGWRSTHDDVEALYLEPLNLYRALTWNPAVRSFSRTQTSSYDLVHIFGLYDLLAPPIASACRQHGIPYVVEPIGMFRPIVRSIALKHFYQWLFGSSLIAGAQKIVATAARERAELIEGGVPSPKIVIRRNGIEAPEHLPVRRDFRRQWHISDSAQVVLYLGRLVSKKSPDLLLEAFAQYRPNAGSEPVLVLAGPDEGDGYRAQLEQQAKRLGIGARVLFTGPIYGDAKWSAYRDADVFVLPSQNENFGNTAAEAVACGMPVLLTDCCGVAPVIDGRAGLAVPHNRVALADGLRQLLTDLPLRRRLQEGCAEVTRALGWAEPLDETEAMYTTLTQAARAQTAAAASANL
jgi:glycosyltransferase involved in cell wall biosynthesis